ncbi:malto-oligosyltrehalose synthase [Larkinella bovis]|uniref:Malto-oligosyltrehalose synthase n=1 Tax=Larkinella bovis TaxID=683041 RepID=A0ABW0I534_9BACT
MNNPVSSYRIQFHAEFPFRAFEKIIPYLDQLGVGTLYASPVFASVPGSQHGYDGVHPHRIDPEIGTEKQLLALRKRLQKRGIGWLQDIVPNHMAFHPENAWLMDVLEKGPLSRFASFFDTAWTSSLFHGRLMVPFLGASLEEVIQNRELTVAYRADRLVLTYGQAVYPLHLRSYGTVLGSNTAPVAIQHLLDQIRPIQQLEEPHAYALAMDEFRQQLAALQHDDTVKAYLRTRLKAINHQPEELRKLADEQVYRLEYHQKTDQRINFRRFFTVSELIGLNMQDDQVFTAFHERIKQFVDEQVFDGLRIDHIDGLYDPSQYLDQLRQLVGESTYLVVEKILEEHETIPPAWPIQGTSGYDFLAQVNNLLTYAGSKAVFTDFYQQLVSDTTPISQQILDKKALILQQHMQGELTNLYQLFLELNLVEENERTALSPESLREAIGTFLVYCPVYRFYGNQFPLNPSEAKAVGAVFRQVRETQPALSAAIRLLEKTLLEKTQQDDESYNRRVARFYRRCMQLTGPLRAKGVEDTLMYTYNRFIGHNEVGDSPAAFGMSANDFHRAMQHRQEHSPLALNATSTHDTKRGEDVRTRLNVLSDLPELWFKTVREWQSINASLTANGPDANDEYFIYQTLVGAYPMPGTDAAGFNDRMQQYLEKALREAKRHSQWNSPNADYENAAHTFVTRLLDPKQPFWKSFQAFLRKIADFGIINSLTQLTLKATCPGVPDVYQGCELWDFSLVDPDNRRPVDYDQRQQWLDDLIQTPLSPTELQRELWQQRADGRIKLWLTHTLLNERKQQPELFAHGRYEPLRVEGASKDHILAFARQHQRSVLVVIVPRNLALLCEKQQHSLSTLDWKDTRICLPAETQGNWTNVLLKTGQEFQGEIRVRDVFKTLPIAVLRFSEPV